MTSALRSHFGSTMPACSATSETATRSASSGQVQRGGAGLRDAGEGRLKSMPQSRQRYQRRRPSVPSITPRPGHMGQTGHLRGLFVDMVILPAWGGQASHQPAFRERHDLVAGDDEVVEEANVHDGSART